VRAGETGDAQFILFSVCDEILRFADKVSKLNTKVPARSSHVNTKGHTSDISSGYYVDFTMYSPPNYECTYDGPDCKC
jgi:hypothetical protein